MEFQNAVKGEVELRVYRSDQGEFHEVATDE
jgi:hypothetical protein